MLIQCPECNQQISDKALSCPHCGYPMQPAVLENIQKKSQGRRKHRRLPNGFGQISEIKGRNLRKPFRAMVTVGKTPEGKPICKPLKPDSYFKTYNEAYEALVKYNKNPYSLEPSITVQELYEKWSKEHFKTLKSQSGIDAIKNAWLYCSTLYAMKAADIRTYHIKGCIENGTAVIKGVKKNTTAQVKIRIKSLFNLMFDYALEYEIVEQNYSRNFKLPEDVKKEKETIKHGHIAFADDEISTLWNHVNDVEDVDMLLIQCYSGWRPRELCALKTENVDFESWTFTGGMKTDAGINRKVPIHSKIRPLVQKRYEDAKAIRSDWLFNSTNEITKQRMHYNYKKYCKTLAKIISVLDLNPQHKLHDCRTHFVTTAKKYNVDEYAIKYIVGHVVSDLTEKVYTKRTFDWLQTEIEKIK